LRNPSDAQVFGKPLKVFFVARVSPDWLEKSCRDSKQLHDVVTQGGDVPRPASIRSGLFAKRLPGAARKTRRI